MNCNSFENQKLSSGIFWIISNNRDFEDYNLISFNMLCDIYGELTMSPTIPPNSKDQKHYNHRKLWTDEIKANPVHRPYNKRDYNYYPRGRISIANNRATIYLNPHINVPSIVSEIKQKFGLTSHNISKVRIFPDNSEHYKCFIDQE